MWPMGLLFKFLHPDWSQIEYMPSKYNTAFNLIMLCAKVVYYIFTNLYFSSVVICPYIHKFSIVFIDS